MKTVCKKFGAFFKEYSLRRFVFLSLITAMLFLAVGMSVSRMIVYSKTKNSMVKTNEKYASVLFKQIDTEMKVVNSIINNYVNDSTLKNLTRISEKDYRFMEALMSASNDISRTASENLFVDDIVIMFDNKDELIQDSQNDGKDTQSKARIEYSFGDGQWIAAPTTVNEDGTIKSTISINRVGKHNVTIRAIDGVGNFNTAYYKTFVSQIDRETPVISEVDNFDNKWIGDDTIINLSGLVDRPSTVSSGINKLTVTISKCDFNNIDICSVIEAAGGVYDLDSKNTKYVYELLLSSLVTDDEYINGMYRVDFMLTDAALNNSAIVSRYIRVDDTNPTSMGELTYQGNPLASSEDDVVYYNNPEILASGGRDDTAEIESGIGYHILNLYCKDKDGVYQLFYYLDEEFNLVSDIKIDDLSSYTIKIEGLFMAYLWTADKAGNKIGFNTYYLGVDNSEDNVTISSSNESSSITRSYSTVHPVNINKNNINPINFFIFSPIQLYV